MSDFFDFDAMQKSLDSAINTTTYETDTRFYVLPKNEKGEGSAVIAFLPDPKGQPLKKLQKINSRNGKRFVSEWSPVNIGLPDPFQEKWSQLYNSGLQEEAKKFSRSFRYVTNIKVIKDPQKPDNNGKIFLYEMSQKLTDKILQVMNPSEQDIALGTERVNVYNPLLGNVFKLIAKKGSNDMVNYDSSTFVKIDKPIYETQEEAENDIKEHCYKLSDFDDPESYKTYDELKKKLEWLTNDGNTQTVNVSVAENKKTEPEVIPTSQPQQTDEGDLDSILKDLVID